MIQANELRIGNILKSVHTGECITVDWLVIKHVMDGNKQSPPYDMSCVYEPIPVTEEILLEWGFENVEYNDYRHQTMIGTLTLYDGVAELHISDLYSVWVSNAHQLQNTFFILTGEELTKK